MLDQIVRGPLLIPKDDGSVAYFPDGVLAGDKAGIIQFAGDFRHFRSHLDGKAVRSGDGIMLPPLLDIHIHIPQHPIRGRFVDGVPDDAPGGKLLAGLQRNVFPTEALCNVEDHAEKVVRQFLADTLAHGVVGGAAYMTPSVIATEIALSILPESWSVGLVLMNQNCPQNLRTDEAGLYTDIERLARRFGRRLIVTDRFAVAVDSRLRRIGSKLADEFGLRTQTHLNEQVTEKELVEKQLYCDYANYTDVYLKDGLLDHNCIAAHCIQMTGDEWAILRDTGTVIAHCPTSNLLLGSGVMPLHEILKRRIPYAIATDVGASPTVSMFAEMKRFLQVHAGRCSRATPEEALFRSTIAPADVLDLPFGRLEIGKPMSFIEVNPSERSMISAIETLLPDDINNPDLTVSRVTVAGRTVYERSGIDA